MTNDISQLVASRNTSSKLNTTRELVKGLGTGKAAPVAAQHQWRPGTSGGPAPVAARHQWWHNIPLAQNSATNKDQTSLLGHSHRLTAYSYLNSGARWRRGEGWQGVVVKGGVHIKGPDLHPIRLHPKPAT